MTMQITSSSTLTFTQSMPNSGSTKPALITPIEPNDSLTPEQKNTAQKNVDEKITEQVDNIKGNYQTAKDIDLMNSYYTQQQKVVDIYMQTSSEESTTTSTEENEGTSAVSALTSAYSELYQIHKEIKGGVGNLPSIDQPEGIETLPTGAQQTSSQTAEAQGNNVNSALSNKQMDSYNSLMMPSTSSYMHLSS